MLPKGYKVSGISSGIKKSKKKDLGLIYSSSDCLAAAVFTANKVKAAPIVLCKRNIKNKIRALIVNSGNANCFTGKQGLSDANTVAKEVAKELKVKLSNMLMASTGIIGVKMPKQRILNNIGRTVSALSKKRINDFASAILTTDTFPKIKSITLNIAGKRGVICGIAKGAGMIYPNLETSSVKHATMLCFILTDIGLSRPLLNNALNEAVEVSFNSISVDGCMSTNDSAFLLCNRMAKNKIINKEGKDYQVFKRGLNLVFSELAKKIVLDGEGATKFITIKIEKARDCAQAKKAAFSIANSNLFKCAIYGADPNWGRIIAALGASAINFNENNLDLYINRKPLLKKSKILKNKDRIKGKNVEVRLVLNQGKSMWVVHTCDLSPKYIKINANYN